jgi:asparagine synthase (glutamine-hydrolysing)
MCGIAGIVGPGLQESQIHRMVRAQEHRGPDQEGVYSSRNVLLGHNRLAIIDPSPTNFQPMVSTDKRFVIVFNGEIYNYQEIKKSLADYKFKTVGDTEVLLAAYIKWGAACIDRLIGMFAFAIWDCNEEVLFCARDRLGIKPFFYTTTKDRFYFASEIKPILAAGVDAEANWATWGNYLRHGNSDYSNETFFRNVFSLSAGEWLRVKRGKIDTGCYWHLPDKVQDLSENKDGLLVENLRELFDDAVRLRLRSDVPLGVNLSGGLDSSSLFATVDKHIQNQKEIAAFTAAFTESKYDESIDADKVPHKQHWQRIAVRLGTDNLWEEFINLARIQEAPYGGLATAAYYHLHKKVKEFGIKVLLDGEGSDELFAGYYMLRAHHNLDLLETRRYQDFRREVNIGSRRTNFDAIRAIRAGIENVYTDGTEFLRPNCIASDLAADVGYSQNFPKPFASRLQNRLYQGLRYTKLPRVLRMNDKLSMANSIELRVPFLDHRLVEYAFGIPGDKKIRSGLGKYIFRKSMSARLPEEVLWANKKAVVTPQREWLAGELRENVESLITDRSFAERGIFNVDNVRKEFYKFCSEPSENSFFVWQWINTELWFREFIDK